MAFDKNSVKGGAGLSIQTKALSFPKVGAFGISFGTKDTIQASGNLGVAFTSGFNTNIIFNLLAGATLSSRLIINISWAGYVGEMYSYSTGFVTQRALPINTSITIQASGVGLNTTSNTFTLTSTTVATNVIINVSGILNTILKAYKRRRFI